MADTDEDGVAAAKAARDHAEASHKAALIAAIVKLRTTEHLSMRKIAARVGVGHSTVHRHLHQQQP